MSSVELIAHTGCFELDLRYTCIVLGTGLLFLLGIEAMLSPKVVQHTDAFVDWAICFTCNVMLLIGVVVRNKWIVGIWLITLLIVFIAAPVAGLIKKFLAIQQTHDDPYLLFCEYMLHLCVYFITGRYVISYIMELHELEAEPPPLPPPPPLPLQSSAKRTRTI